MELGAETRDAAVTAAGAVALQVAMVAWLTHTCGCPGVLIIEPTEEDTGADPSAWCTAPFAEKATAGEGAAVITPPATRSIVVPGLASCGAAGTDLRVLSGNFSSDACPAVAACVNRVVFCPEITFSVCCPGADDVLTPSVP